MIYDKRTITKDIRAGSLALLIAFLCTAEGLSSETKDDTSQILGRPTSEVGDFGRHVHLFGKPLDQEAKDQLQTEKRSRLRTPEPHTALEHNNRGIELGMTKGLWDEAIKEHEAALKAEPGNEAFRTNLSAAHLRYGNSLLRKLDYQQAEDQFRMAIGIDPRNLSAKEGLDKCLKEKCRPDNSK
jgi:tetratricopeptide (TPR) repeat protein